MLFLPLIPFFITGSHVNTRIFNDTDFALNNESNHSLDSTTQQLSFHPSDIEPPSDDDYTTIETPTNQHQPIKLAES